jgi:hypothetical protein
VIVKDSKKDALLELRYLEEICAEHWKTIAKGNIIRYADQPMWVESEQFKSRWT